MPKEPCEQLRELSAPYRFIITPHGAHEARHLPSLRRSLDIPCSDEVTSWRRSDVCVWGVLRRR